MKVLKKSNRYFKLLSQIFLFRDVNADIVSHAYFSEECTCVLFEAGEKIFTRNSYQKCMGVVLSGELRAVKVAANGSGVILNTFCRGGIFGVAGMFHQLSSYVSEIVVKKQSRVLFLPQTLLHQLFIEEPKTAENYIVFLTERICYLNSCIDHFTGGSARGRISSYILSLCAQNRNPAAVELPCSMTRLADSLDIGRASLYRTFDALEKEKIICRNGKTLIILDAEKLKQG